MNKLEKQLPEQLSEGRFCVGYLVCLLIVFLSSSAHGQTAPGTQPPSGTQTATATEPAPGPTTQTTTVSANVNEVSLDLVVHDKHHRPVLDLKPGDLVVTDDGTPVTLTGLHLVDASTSANTGHLVTFVFDHFIGSTARSAREIANRVLKTLPENGFSFSVLDFGGRLRLIQRFTDNRKDVENAIDIDTESQAVSMQSTLSLGVNIVTDKADAGRAKAAAQAEKDLIAIARTGADAEGAHVGAEDRARAQVLLTALEDCQKTVQDQHAHLQLAGLLALVRAQQQVPERKAIIYFTQNSQMDSAAKAMLKTITGAASKAGVSIYTVDMDALGNHGQYQAANALLNGQRPYNPTAVVVDAHGDTAIPAQQEGFAGVQGDPSPVGPVWGPAQDVAQMTDFMRGNNESRENPFDDTKSPMAGLAKDTGGIYIDAQNNVKKPLQQMLQDMTTYYEASYVPPFKEYDGAFRTIAIKPLRTGLVIQSKTGYFALAPGAQAGIRPFEVPLLKLLKEPELPMDLKFHASVLRFGDLPDGNANTLAVEIPVSELKTKEDPQTNLYAAHVSIVAQIKDKNGLVVEHFGEDISKRGALDAIDGDEPEVINFERHFVEIPGEYELDIALLDQMSGKMSAERIKFVIPASASGPSMSDIVLVQKMDPFEEDSDPTEPLLYGHGRVTPNISGEVPAAAKDLSLFLILHPDPKATVPPTLEMQVSRNGKAGRLTPLPLHLASDNAPTPYLASFKAKALAPGQYEVKAILNQDGKTAVQQISFTVAGNGTAAGGAPGETGKGGSSSADESSFTPEAAPSAAGQLAITVPTNPMPPPSPDVIKQLIADAQERAIKYTDSLPNFLCIQVTTRSVDPSGRGRWRLRDTITELLRYRDKNETRTTLEVNGKPSNVDRDAMQGPLSSGELGGVLTAVFAPSAKAEFTWKETDALAGGTVQVFSYSVAKQNSAFSVRGSNGMQPTVAFHGLVYIDPATRSVRRISLIADDLPKDFPTHATSINVDYDYVVINEHDYLMPVSAEVSVQIGHHEVTLNTIEFRNYRRFGSSVKILNFNPVVKQ